MGNISLVRGERDRLWRDVRASTGQLKEASTSKHTQLLWDCCCRAVLRGEGTWAGVMQGGNDNARARLSGPAPVTITVAMEQKAVFSHNTHVPVRHC